MGLLCGCFGWDNKRMTKEEERLASDEARAKAAEAAQKRSAPLFLPPYSSVFHYHSKFGFFFFVFFFFLIQFDDHTRITVIFYFFFWRIWVFVANPHMKPGFWSLNFWK